MPLNPINGTDFNDVIGGTDSGDLIHGLLGNDFILGSAGDDRIDGGGGEDFIQGDFGDDKLYGGDDYDQLDGGQGNDYLFGGAGNDLLTGGSFFLGGDGEDWLYGGAGDDHIFAQGYAADSFDHVFGGTGNDTIEFLFDPFRSIGGEIHGEAGIDILNFMTPDFVGVPDLGLYLAISGPNQGASYNGATMVIDGIDRLNIVTSVGDDVIIAGSDWDAIDVRQGANTVDAGAGDDRITYWDGNVNTIEGGDGNDTLEIVSTLSSVTIVGMTLDARGPVVVEGFGSVISGIENYIVGATDVRDIILFGSGDDVFNGYAGNDLAEGHDGDDELIGGGGRDRLFGGNGNDMIRGGSGLFDADSNDYIDGAAGNDQLEGGDGADTIIGGDGNDRIYGGTDYVGTYYGDQFSDLIRGGNGHDTIYEGFNGGLAQFDRIFGDAGNDRVVVESNGQSTVNGGAGIDTLQFWDRSNTSPSTPDIILNVNRVGLPTSIVSMGYTLTSMEVLDLYGGRGDDVIGGGDYADIIRVGMGNNTVNAYGGNDIIGIELGNVGLGSINSIDGGTGLDTLLVQQTGFAALNFTVTGTSATDNYGSMFTNIERFEVTGSGAADTVIFGASDDLFVGGLGNDFADGGAGNDGLIGGLGDDTLVGGDGRDTLAGGKGFDTLTGGLGDDKFRFGVFDGAVDEITDFLTGHDRLLVRSEDVGFAGLDAPTIIDSGLFAIGAATANSGQFVLEIDGNNGVFVWDNNGTADGGRYVIANLTSSTSMSFVDIYLF